MEPFIGQIMMFGGNFAPRGWAFCNGSLLPIASNEALFSILGTMYGGDGRTTFALPDLRGRFAMHPGQGPGLAHRQVGQKGGTEEVTLSSAQLPAHTHPVSIQKAVVRAGNEDADTSDPEGHTLAISTSGDNYSEAGPVQDMAPNSVGLELSVGNTGGNQAHTNMPPYQCINFIIALQGIYPSRS